ncbi:WD40 repeat-like protein [Sistotremastrum suecicum HHB10207 ss-3]|uniref:WD40 repeat-like protein n=1 Tax=Sistotremastrum suecicum HHB10207 ss-3 TaxID=1314776 RepID=A0A165XRM4_9AGAM|nr:WD40 repeat-like protein [Sistotremastrum suecicum HHB10207 ss-3]
MSLVLERVLPLVTSQSVNCLGFLNRDSVVVSGGNDGKVVLWHLDSHARYIIDLGSPVLCLASVSHEGIELVCGLADGCLMTVELENFHETPKITHRVAHTCPIVTVAYNSKWHFLFTGGQEDGIQVWRPFKIDSDQIRWLKEASLEANAVENGQIVQALGFADDEDTLVVTYVEGVILLLDVVTGLTMKKFEVGQLILSSFIDPSMTRILVSTAKNGFEIRSLLNGSIDASDSISSQSTLFLGPVAFLSTQMVALSDPSGDLQILRPFETNGIAERCNHDGEVISALATSCRFVTTATLAKESSVIRLWSFSSKPPDCHSMSPLEYKGKPDPELMIVDMAQTPGFLYSSFVVQATFVAVLLFFFSQIWLDGPELGVFTSFVDIVQDL